MNKEMGKGRETFHKRYIIEKMCVIMLQ